MPVKEVRQLGWTRRSAGVTVLLAMEEHRRQAGARVLQLREARRWTHEDLAHAAGLSVKTVSRFERGRNEGRRTTIRKLATALDVTEADIIGSPPAPLGLSVAQENGDGDRLDEAIGLLRQLLSRQEALAEAVAGLAGRLDAADQTPARSGKRRAS